MTNHRSRDHNYPIRGKTGEKRDIETKYLAEGSVHDTGVVMEWAKYDYIQQHLLEESLLISQKDEFKCFKLKSMLA